MVEGTTGSLGLQARLFEVEVAFDAVPDSVPDLALCLLAFPAPVVLDAEGPDTNLFIVGDAPLAIRYGGFAR